MALVHLKDTPTFETVIPSKIFEAMAMGLPILLASPRGEASRIVEGDGVGLWVRPEDPGELAGAVSRLMGDKALTLRLGKRAEEMAPFYSREKQARDMLASLEAAVAG